jgi:predicted O-methyltransferase YrrM
MRSKDILFIVGSTLIMGVLSGAGWLFIGEKNVLLLMIIISLLVLITIQLSIYRRLQSQLKNQDAIEKQRQAYEYKQVESLISVLRIKLPLPPMRDWAISPDFANLIVSLIYEQQPKMVLEAGSGVSTLVAAYSLREFNFEGKIISLEHDEHYADKTTQNIALHNLQDIARVIFSPLKEVAVNGKAWPWYDLSFLGEVEPIDFLIIDGPPGSIHQTARYPALPLLIDKLSDGAVILIDDAHRKDEKEMVDIWMKEFDCFTQESFDTEKGAVVLRKNGSRH